MPDDTRPDPRFGTTAPLLPLALAAPGALFQVARLAGCADFQHRMVAMGLGPGRRLQVTQNGGGQMVIALGETRIALGRGMAQKILVQPINAPA
ncbi:FeoA family protein [Rhodobacter capsulatus]|nr:FeoA family protein [Rhodobacter capsulatus]